MIIGTWNVKGLNQPFKQKEVLLFLRKNKIEFFDCLETKIKKVKAKPVMRKFSKEWNHCYNYPYVENGRIWLLWKKHINVQVLKIHKQYIHYKVENLASNFKAFITVVYSRNEVNVRTILWHDLQQIGIGIKES